jgi:fermentation-respiration switch protein FrsA (DUF1100 family)
MFVIEKNLLGFGVKFFPFALGNHLTGCGYGQRDRLRVYRRPTNSVHREQIVRGWRTHVFWFLPGVSLLVYSQFDTQARLQEITAPILIVHCTQDPVIPFHFGQEVFAAARPPKDFLPISASCHEESSLLAPNQYRATLQKFLTTLDK